jgi:quercetin dioxygenase-like cupin family protein
MITASIDQIEFQRGWSDTRPDVAFAFGLAVSTVNGSSSSQVICVALEPGKSGGRHAHSAEEILIVLEGTAELTVGDERERLSAGGIAVIPAKSIHEPVNVGRETLRFLAIFPSAAVLHSWEGRIEPLGAATFLTPPIKEREIPV